MTLDGTDGMTSDGTTSMDRRDDVRWDDVNANGQMG